MRHEPEQKTKRPIHTGVRGQLQQSLVDITGNQHFKKGQKVIIQPIEDGFLVTPYEEVKENLREDMLESGEDIKLGLTCPVKGIDPKKYFYFDEFFKRINAPLFPSEDSPSLAEINQRKIPNCSFLAVLQSILNHPKGGDYIRNMLSDNGDGTTTVRLFDPLSNEPSYYTVENAIAVQNTTAQSGHIPLCGYTFLKTLSLQEA